MGDQLDRATAFAGHHSDTQIFVYWIAQTARTKQIPPEILAATLSSDPEVAPTIPVEALIPITNFLIAHTKPVLLVEPSVFGVLTRCIDSHRSRNSAYARLWGADNQRVKEHGEFVGILETILTKLTARKEKAKTLRKGKTYFQLKFEEIGLKMKNEAIEDPLAYLKPALKDFIAQLYLPLDRLYSATISFLEQINDSRALLKKMWGSGPLEHHDLIRVALTTNAFVGLVRGFENKLVTFVKNTALIGFDEHAIAKSAADVLHGFTSAIFRSDITEELEEVPSGVPEITSITLGDTLDTPSAKWRSRNNKHPSG